MTFDSMMTRELIDFKRRYGVGVERVMCPLTPEPLALDPGTPDSDDGKDCATLYMELLDAYVSEGIFGGSVVNPLLLALGFKSVEEGINGT